MKQFLSQDVAFKISLKFQNRHSEKKKSAKPSLPSVICRALGKSFAECRPNTRQRKVAVNHDGCFAECLKDDTRVSSKNLYNFFPEIVCRVSALCKEFFLFFLKFLAITLGKAGKSGVFLQFLPALPSAVAIALGKEADTRQSVYNCLFFFLFLHSNTSITHSNRKFHRYSSHSSNP